MYIEAAIQSCLNQTVRDIELIIVDDASTDKTPAILEKFKNIDKRVTVIRNEKNLKLPASLNIGFGKAQGEFFTWTSDDNQYLPSALEELYNNLEKNPAADVAYANCVSINDSGEQIGLVRVYPKEKLIDGNCIGACFLYRKIVHETLGGYSEDLFCAEDYDFWLRAATRFQMQPISNVLYKYRFHPKSLTQSRPDKTYIAAETALIKNLPHMNWLTHAQKSKAYLRLVKHGIKTKNKNLIFMYFKEALKNSIPWTIYYSITKAIKMFFYRKK